jgi:hypothetical protein
MVCRNGVEDMSRNYLAFDLEIASDIPKGVEDWHPLAPLGITVAATVHDLHGGVMPHYGVGIDWASKKSVIKERMSRGDAITLVDYLSIAVENGFTILGWNSLGFDFDVLAIESGLKEECAKLALNHVDMMFHVFCVKGFAVGLDNAAKAMKTNRKTEGVHGDMAPQMWRDGKYNEVIEYVSQDVRATLDLAQACEAEKVFRWMTKRGPIAFMPLTDGWLTVEDALKLPEPDVSWMDKPWPRSKFTNWMG